MIKAIKSKILTYLFQEWVNNETDVEVLISTQQVINQKREEIAGPIPVMGFKTYSNIK